MNPEAVFWYTLRVVSTILGSFTAYMVLKYLNKKPLGMQTIFDEIVKDTIYLNVLNWLIFIVTGIAVDFLAPLNHYVISAIIICRVTVAIAVINQLSILMFIRYLHVFYPTQMNNAHFAKNLARLFLIFISFTTSIFLDKANTPFCYVASGKNIENGFSAKPVPFFITMGICVMILIFTQCKIEKFNKSVDSQQQDVQGQDDPVEEAGEENQNSSNTYISKNTYRIVLIILFLFLISVALFTFLTPWVHFYDITLRVSTIKYVILHNVIPIIFIVRNDTLFCFMKIQIMKILKCKCRNNQIEPMIELNVL